MAEKRPKTPFWVAFTALLSQHWSSIVTGSLFGAVVGMASPTIGHAVSAIATGVSAAVYRHLTGISVWPKRGISTTVVIMLAALILYAGRLVTFVKRFWSSWQAGLASGIGLVWFVVSAVTFILLNLTGHLKSWLFLSVGVAFTMLLAVREERLIDKAEALSETDPDNPISKKEEDIIGRDAVVAAMIRAAVVDCAPVIALTGPFGDGKTSVLNLFSAALNSRNDAVSVRFSTWLPVDEKTLVSSLLSAVIAALETRLFIPKIRKNFVGVTRLFFSVLPKVPGPILDLVEKPSQDQQIAELRRNLSHLPVRVVVLLDDVDRMQRKELELLFKILRGVAEFPQFTYICAFHRDSVVETLCNDGARRTREQAQNFLEKFFPDEIPLPKIEASQLAVEFERRFYAICDRVNLITDPSERQKFKDDFRTFWQQSLKGYFTNLRRVKSFTNRLNRSLPIVREEVNLNDFVLLEILRMVNPVLYEEIYRSAKYFMFARWRSPAWLEILHPDEKEERKLRDSYFHRLFDPLPAETKEITLAVLRQVFPMVKSYLDGTSALGPFAISVQAQRERRVYHPDFFPRYFIFNVPTDMFGEEELSQFIGQMNGETELDKAVARLKNTYEELNQLPMKRWDFLRRVDLAIDRFNSMATQALAIGVSELSDELETEQAAFDEIVGLRIVFRAADRLGSRGLAQAVIETVIRDTPSDRFATEVINESASNRHRWIEAETAIDKEKLEETFRARMSAKYGPTGRASFFRKEYPIDIVPLGRWALSGFEGREQAHEYLIREFQANHVNLARFVRCFFPLQDDHPAADPIQTMKAYFPPEELKNLLDEFRDSASSSTEESQAIEEFMAELKRRNEPAP